MANQKHIPFIPKMSTQFKCISACDHYLEKGFAPVYARENITSMYDAYHSLGGDGIVTDMVQQTMKLPYMNGGETRSNPSR